MQIVGLVGHIGAGKTSIAKYLQSRGYLRVTLSDFLLEEAAARGLPPTRSNLQDLGDEVRQRKGGAVLAERALERAMTAGSRRVVIDGVRNPDEVRALKGTNGAVLVAVRRPDQSGGQAEQQAAERERNPNEPPWGQRVADSIPMADFVIENSGALEDLYAKVAALLAFEVMA
jgi:dephospho-CoA kinase